MIGKLKRLGLRNIWKNESTSFAILKSNNFYALSDLKYLFALALANLIIGCTSTNTHSDTVSIPISYPSNNTYQPDVISKDEFFGVNIKNAKIPKDFTSKKTRIDNETQDVVNTYLIKKGNFEIVSIYLYKKKVVKIYAFKRFNNGEDSYNLSNLITQKIEEEYSGGIPKFNNYGDNTFITYKYLSNPDTWKADFEKYCYSYSLVKNNCKENRISIYPELESISISHLHKSNSHTVILEYKFVGYQEALESGKMKIKSNMKL